MIKLENTKVMNFEGAIRGMRNPLESHAQSDSYYENRAGKCNYDNYILGEKDLDLAKRLCNAGSDHRKFMRQVFVSVDITAPLYWFKEYDTYKVGTTANSTSTMHTIHKKEFTMDDFSYDEMESLALATMESSVIPSLEVLRKLFIDTKDKKYWYSMIQLLPNSYNQTRTCTMTYENLRNMYYSRHNHKLDEWREFCGWIGMLPYGKELVVGV